MSNDNSGCGCLAILVIAAMIAFHGCGNDDSASNNAEHVENTAYTQNVDNQNSDDNNIKAAEENATPTREDIKALANVALKNSSLKYPDVTIFVDDDGSCNVMISVDGEEGWDDESTIATWDNDAKKLFKALYTSGFNIDDARLDVEADMVNTRTGATSKDHIYGIHMTKDIAKNIHNWNNVDLEEAVGRENVKKPMMH